MDTPTLFNINLDNFTPTNTLMWIIYAILIGGLIVFLYKNLIKDIFKTVKNRKNKVAETEKKQECADEDIRNHYFFQMMLTYIKIDLNNIFDIDEKKDAQFYLLGKCKFITFYKAMHDLVEQTLTNKIVFDGEPYDKITYPLLISIQQKTMEDYGHMFLKYGGNEYVLNKFNEYHSKRFAGSTEMLECIFNQDFFNKDNKSLLVGILTVYTYNFIQTFEDLKANHKTINGSINNEMAKFILDDKFKNTAKEIDIDM